MTEICEVLTAPPTPPSSPHSTQLSCLPTCERPTRRSNQTHFHRERVLAGVLGLSPGPLPHRRRPRPRSLCIHEPPYEQLLVCVGRVRSPSPPSLLPGPLGIVPFPRCLYRLAAGWWYRPPSPFLRLPVVPAPCVVCWQRRRSYWVVALFFSVLVLVLVAPCW
jgi:hypothetical protein